MIAPSAPFHALTDDITWFVKCTELRVLHVTTSGADRALTLEILARSEGHSSNHSPYFVLEDHVAKDDTGFLSRAHRVREIHEERRRVLAKDGLSLGESVSVDESVEPAVAFGKQLLACLAAQQNVPELTGLTVVLAPTVIGEVKRFCDDLIGLVRAPSLSQVRWMVLETEPARILEPLQSSLHEALLTSTAIVPESDRRADMAARLEAMAKAPVGGSPHVQLGFAGPRHVVAPPRFSELGRDPQSPETKALLQRELGPQAFLVGEGGSYLRRCITGAALSARDGKFSDAAAQQSAACSACLEAGLFELACTLEMVLATYLVAGGQMARAIVAFQTAAQRARSHSLPSPEAQAYTGLGSLLMVERRVPEAVVAYRTAAELAEKANIPVLAIEAYRCAGQASLDAGAHDAATTLWTRALAVAGKSPPAEIAGSSAPTVARALAKVLQGLGSFAAAQSLIEYAERLETTPAHPEPTSGGHDGATNGAVHGEPQGGA